MSRYFMSRYLILSQLNPVQILISNFCKIYRMSRKSPSICAFQYAGSGEVPNKTFQVSYVTPNTHPLGSLPTLILKVSTEFGQQHPVVQSNPHRHNTRTLYVLLLLSLYDIFRWFIRPVSSTVYRYVKEKCTVEDAFLSKST
jgi:hypothetical protein